jgi:hypothetical protein
MANNDYQIQLDLNQDQVGQVVQNVSAGTQTTLTFRVEQSKIPDIRKDCFQVKSNLLTVDNLVFHFTLQFLIKLK